MPGETETKQPRAGNDRWGEAARAVPDGGATQESATPLEKALRKVTEQDPNPGPSYYDISLLKPPVWTPEVGAYFYLGGLSAGAFLVARMAERFGGGQYRDLTRTGTTVAALAALPCAPLLIVDLGDPKRFHHMLRVFKPHSPMNLGSWVLTGYSGLVFLAALREWLGGRRTGAPPPGRAKLADAAVALTDAAGVPLALGLAGYTGVLLSTTSTPIWCKNPWLGALFSAGAMSAGVAATRLSLEAQKRAQGSAGEETAADTALTKAAGAAHAAEAVALTGYLAAAGRLAAPLTRGKLKRQFWGGAIATGLLLPEILGRLPVPKQARPWVTAAGAVAVLLGGYALRAAFVAAGRPSASDPDAARQISRPTQDGVRP